MSNDDKIEKMIAEYRFTVVALSTVLIATMVVFAAVVLVYVPDVMVMAMDDYFSNTEFLITE